MNLVRPDLISQPAKGQVLKPRRRGRADWSGFENSSFEFGACFGFRVSDFGFVLAWRRCADSRISKNCRSRRKEAHFSKDGKIRASLRRLLQFSRIDRASAG